jgi:hypothetical protein
MRECARQQELQNAELQQNEPEHSIQRGLSIAIRTFAGPISATSGSEEPSAGWNCLCRRYTGTVATRTRDSGRNSLCGQRNRPQMGRRRRSQHLGIQSNRIGAKSKVVASEDVKARISSIGINKCARESGFDQKNFIGKLVRGLPVKRNTYEEFARWLRGHQSTNGRTIERLESNLRA